MTQKARNSHIAQIHIAYLAVDSHTRTLDGGGMHLIKNVILLNHI